MNYPRCSPLAVVPRDEIATGTIRRLLIRFDCGPRRTKHRREQTLQLKLLDELPRRIAKFQASNPKPEARPGGPGRLLLEEDYFSLVFFGLCFASHFKRVQDEVITLLIPRETEA